MGCFLCCSVSIKQRPLWGTDTDRHTQRHDHTQDRQTHIDRTCRDRSTRQPLAGTDWDSYIDGRGHREHKVENSDLALVRWLQGEIIVFLFFMPRWCIIGDSVNHQCVIIVEPSHSVGNHHADFPPGSCDYKSLQPCTRTPVSGFLSHVACQYMGNASRYGFELYFAGD